MPTVVVRKSLSGEQLQCKFNVDSLNSTSRKLTKSSCFFWALVIFESKMNKLLRILLSLLQFFEDEHCHIWLYLCHFSYFRNFSQFCKFLLFFGVFWKSLTLLLSVLFSIFSFCVFFSRENKVDPPTVFFRPPYRFSSFTLPTGKLYPTDFFEFTLPTFWNLPYRLF